MMKQTVATVINGKTIKYVDIDNPTEVTELPIKDYLEMAVKKRLKTYVHNLAVNGSTLTIYLLKNKFKHTNGPLSNLKGKWFKKTESDDGSVFSIEIKLTDKSRLITFCDSRKILNFKEKQLKKEFLGEYVDDKDLTEDEKLIVVAKSLKIMFDEGHTADTMSANAWKFWKQSYKLFINKESGKFSESKMRNIIPILPKKIDRFIRESYIGGWVYLNPLMVDKISNQKSISGVTLDANSMFPSVMYNELMPWGWPIEYKGKYEYDEEYPLYIQELIVKNISLKKDKVPMIQHQGPRRHLEHDYIYCEDEVKLILTSVDIELMRECYDINEEDITYIRGYKFRATDKFFRDYIDYWMDKKNKETGAKRKIAKLFLNSLYGKFGSKIRRQVRDYTLGEDGEEVKLDLGKEDTGQMYYTAIAAFIAAYARGKTVRGANANFKHFIYADTDSLHLLCNKKQVKGIELDQKELGKWKVESEFTDAVYIGLKCYGEYADYDNNGKPYWQFKVAGLPEEAIKQIKSKDEFYPGKEVKCKVLTKTANGVEYIERKFILGSNQIGKISI